MLKKIESLIEAYIWRKIEEVFATPEFKAKISKEIEGQKGYIWLETRRILDTDAFVELAAEKAAAYADVVRLKIIDGDVLVVPENTEIESMGQMASMFEDIRIAGIVAANLDDIGVIRTKALRDAKD